VKKNAKFCKFLKSVTFLYTFPFWNCGIAARIPMAFSNLPRQFPSFGRVPRFKRQGCE